MAKMKDGMHKLAGHKVYVEDGIVRYGIVHNPTNGEVITHPYRWSSKDRCYNREYGLTAEAFRAGANRMTIVML